MRFNCQRLATLGVSITLALLLCASIQPSAAQSSNPISRGLGGLAGAASGAIAGGVAGANAGANAAGGSSEGNSSISASASASQSNGSGGSTSGGSASLSANANLSSASGPSSSSGGMSASGSASIDASSSGSSLSSQANISIGSSTPKPEGLVDKVKEILKGGKEMIKNSVDSLTKDDKKSETKISAESSVSAGSGASQASGSASLSLSGSGNSGSSSSSSSSSNNNNNNNSNSNSNSYSNSGSNSNSNSNSNGASGSSLSASTNVQTSGSQSSGSASASLSVGLSTPKPEGLLGKMSKLAEKGKEAFKDAMDQKKDSSSSSGGSQSVSGGVSANISSGSSSGGGVSMNANADIKIGKSDDGMKKFDERHQEKKEGPVDKVQKLVSKGTEAVRETLHSIEDKASSVGEKISKAMDDNIRKPMQSTSGSGVQASEGQLSVRAQATAQLNGPGRDKHLLEVKKEQEGKLARPSSLKDVVTDAKSKGVIPQNEDRSVLRGNHADEKSVAVEMFDKAHEISKIPVETVLKPIDKMLGYEKDPLMRIYDNSHEIMRGPLSLVSKPVESVLTGAFKTTDEAKRDSDRLLATTSEQERREAKIREEITKKEDRSVVGSIADKTVELATKPFEIVLKPFDHALGFDKDGKKNPFLRAIDEVYGLSKKPLDAVAKPFESILKKMADGEQLYQVSLRFNDESSDPKLVTRLADGALNVADRVLTKPLEIVMKPLNHVLGYDEPGKKNPIMEAAHQLKNATKVGVELFTKPIDRIIKEIAEIGENKSDAQREADYERQKQEASRLVEALDKLHEAAQYPFEIVLRPMGKALGTSKAGKKDPLLRAWDVIHQVVRTPIQVISKPWEEAILGDRARKSQKVGINVEAKASANGQQGQAGAKASVGANIGPVKAGASISLKNGNEQPHRKNIITDSIKTVEKYATKPLDVITSPIRKMILGEDNEKVGSETDKNNREIQAKAQIGSGGSKAQASAQFKSGPSHSPKSPDKIMKTLEKMNNVILKPLEELTQPISDILSSEKKIEVKAQVSAQTKQQPQQQPQQQQQQQPQQQQSQQQQPKQISASAQAQIKKT